VTQLQALAQQVYDQSRAHYKGGVKGANKRYNPKIAFPASMTGKVATRATNAAAFMTAHATAPNPWVLRGTGMLSFLGLGNLLLSTRNTFGQCMEMSAVATAFFHRLSHGPIKIAITHEFDHAFVVIGILPPVRRTMSDLAHARADLDCWVVDAWAGVFCHVSQYLADFRFQARMWNAQGKQVYVDGWRRPTRAYRDLQRAVLTYVDPSDPRIRT
jgi:hypothetical protein